MRIAILLVVLLFAPVAASADIFSNGTLDLKVLKLGKQTVVDFGVGSVGVEISTSNGWEITACPTRVDVRAGLCRWDWFAGKTGAFCSG